MSFGTFPGFHHSFYYFHFPSSPRIIHSQTNCFNTSLSRSHSNPFLLADFQIVERPATYPILSDNWSCNSFKLVLFL